MMNLINCECTAHRKMRERITLAFLGAVVAAITVITLIGLALV